MLPGAAQPPTSPPARPRALPPSLPTLSRRASAHLLLARPSAPCRPDVRREVLCVQPTGAGKSMCFQAAAAVLEGCTLIVSPLLSLMFDQVESMSASGIRAATLNSMMATAEREEVMRSLAAGELDLLYTSPEQLDKNQKLIAILARSTPSPSPSPRPEHRHQRQPCPPP